MGLEGLGSIARLLGITLLASSLGGKDKKMMYPFILGRVVN